MTFELTVLGVSAAQPAFSRHPSAQFLAIHNQRFLIDCGEGTQMQLSAFGLRRSNLDHIFITHLHGDHYFGLMGLLTSFALNGRTAPLMVYSPAGLKPIVDAHAGVMGGTFPYTIHFVEVLTDRETLLLENEFVTVRAFPLDHRIPTVGYRFDEQPRPLKINPDKIAEFGLSIPQIKAVKGGEDLVLESGLHLSNAALTIPPAPPRSFAYCSDTRYRPALAEVVQGVDLLYHESTFCEDAADRAAQTMHATAAEAARIAAAAGVKQLLLGHFSSRYPETTVFEQEARTIFPNTLAAEEGQTYTVPLQNLE
ncbi:MAG: ribonuclease Z [Phaeodactylibacter sp.]|nr:ribonuclease Z [Phaeodactylibacter sp.]